MRIPLLFSLLAIGCLFDLAAQGEPNEWAVERSLDFAKRHEVFKDFYFTEHEQEFVRLVQEGQSPRTLFIGCSDSRVIPELIIDARPGDLFVIRAAGNFVPYYDTSIAWDGVAASLYYAVEVLRVKEIIVCGHSHCGAIAGLFDEGESGFPEEILERWLQFGGPAKRLALDSAPPNASKSELAACATYLSILFQLDNLLSYPFIRALVERQELFLHGWFFDIERGQISYYDPLSQRFALLNSAKNTEKTRRMYAPASSKEVMGADD